MPLTPKGRKIEHAMEHEYGEKKGKQVFYASKNKGTIKGVEGHKHKALKKAKEYTGHYQEDASGKIRHQSSAQVEKKGLNRY